MMEVKVGDKVYLGDRRGAFRVVGYKVAERERCVCVCTGAHYSEFNKARRHVKADPWQEPPPGVLVSAVVPVADLVRDTRRRGWRERWRQTEFDFERKNNG
jgi:hypothetical protein